MNNLQRATKTVADNLAVWQTGAAALANKFADLINLPVLNEDQIKEIGKHVSEATKHLKEMETARMFVTRVLDEEKKIWMAWEKSNIKELAELGDRARALATKSLASIAAEKARVEREARIAREIEAERVKMFQDRLISLTDNIVGKFHATQTADECNQMIAELQKFSIKPGYYGEFADNANAMLDKWVGLLQERADMFEQGSKSEIEAHAQETAKDQQDKVNEAIEMAQADAFMNLPEAQPMTKPTNQQVRIKATATEDGIGHLAKWYAKQFGVEKFQFMLTEAAKQRAVVPGVSYREEVTFVAR